MMMPTFSALFVALLVGSAAAHPGDDHRAEARKRAAHLATLDSADLSHCEAQLAASGHTERLVRRRSEEMMALRRKYNLDHEPPLTKRQLSVVLGKSHKSTQAFTPDSPASAVFATNKSCVLTPEITEGPFWVSGELIRQDLVEKQKGIPLTFSILTVDYKTCKPVAGEFVEMWNTNSSGVYSGVSSTMNGNVADTGNVNVTWLRGIQQSNADGVVTFHSLVPGHYPIRANHVHVMNHMGAKLLPNNTIQGGSVTHVGQVYFDQSLLDLVESTAPYSSNTQAWTKNAQDFLIANGVANNDDPFVNYSLLGSKVEDGIFAWITLGVDTNNKRHPGVATWWGPNGGTVNPNNTGSFGFGPPS